MAEHNLCTLADVWGPADPSPGNRPRTGRRPSFAPSTAPGVGVSAHAETNMGRSAACPLEARSTARASGATIRRPQRVVTSSYAFCRRGFGPSTLPKDT